MAEEKKDILEQGAIVQRDKETFAVAPHLPGGLVTPAILRKMADVAEKYNIAAMKITSACRIAMVGFKEEDLDQVWADLDLPKGHAIGICVRSVKMCPGTTFCKKGKQDAVALGLEFDKLYHGMPTPGKTKIGVSGCTNSCAESTIKDIGLVGMPKGWRLYVGGCAQGAKTRIGELFAENLTTEEAKEMVAKIMAYYKGTVTKNRRLGAVIDELGGIEVFKKNVLEYQG